MSKNKKAKERLKRIQNIRAKEKAVFMKLGAKIKAYFLAGVLVTAPVGMTFYLAYKLIMFIDRSVARLIPPQFSPDKYLPFTVPGLGVVLLIAVMIFIGMFAAGFLGRLMIKIGEWIVYKMPFISSIYSLFKQIFQTFLLNKEQSFEKAVLLQYPRQGIWTIGFISSEGKGEIKDKLGEKMLNIFVPTTPNPTSGFLLFVAEKDVIYLDMKVEDALKMVISCGIVEPENLPIEK